jgi:hypothetical protein
MSETRVEGRVGPPTGFAVFRSGVPEDVQYYGWAPDAVSGCVLMAAFFERSGYPLELVDQSSTTVVAQVGRPST